MEMISLEKELQENSYPGRGIILGKTADGKKAAAAYFIMGRSEKQQEPGLCGRRTGNPHTGI